MVTILKTQTLANGKTYSWMPGGGRLSNPPNTVYELLAFCIRCRDKWPQELLFCPHCRTRLRHKSRHSKKKVSRY